MCASLKSLCSGSREAPGEGHKTAEEAKCEEGIGRGESGMSAAESKVSVDNSAAVGSICLKASSGNVLTEWRAAADWVS